MPVAITATGRRIPVGSVEWHRLEYAAWVGALTALELLAATMNEATDVLDAAANVYDEICATLEGFERRAPRGQE